MRKRMYLVLLLMVIGFAAVSTTLYINGNVTVSANPSDFDVYFSDALVNGIQDRNVIKNKQNIEFETEFASVNQTYQLEYYVTNGSKNYDASLSVDCTESDDYLDIENVFSTVNNLESFEQRKGILTIKLKKQTTEDITKKVKCKINAFAEEKTN